MEFMEPFARLVPRLYPCARTQTNQKVHWSLSVHCLIGLSMSAWVNPGNELVFWFDLPDKALLMYCVVGVSLTGTASSV